jgi:glycosyltransferase involved in cell wall biosynthesis
MIRPDEIMLIDSSYFNQNEQYPEMYDQYSVTRINGFPTDAQVMAWLRSVNVVVTCEIFYNPRFVEMARSAGVKTINQYNWEFADYLRQPELPLPDKLVAPSKWMLEEARRLWGSKVEYLPTPVFIDDFEEIKAANYERTGKKRFLHIMGRQAINDRNGTQDLLQAMRYSGEDFELVIKAQSGNVENRYNDPRITIDTSNPANEIELYRDFDALILPRRYGGQCLPMTEALCAGMPVLMTDISPNNKILPPHWVVKAAPTGRFMTRTWIDMYTVDHATLGQRLDFAAKKDLRGDKVMAYNLGYSEFSNHELELRWEQLIRETYGESKNSIEGSIGV